MAKMDKCVAYVSAPPVIEISGGVVHIRDFSGEARWERTMSIRCLEKTLERGARALARYAKGEVDVIVDG